MSKPPPRQVPSQEHLPPEEQVLLSKIDQYPLLKGLIAGQVRMHPEHPVYSVRQVKPDGTVLVYRIINDMTPRTTPSQ
jgi:hypothetical protein